MSQADRQASATAPQNSLQPINTVKVSNSSASPKPSKQELEAAIIGMNKFIAEVVIPYGKAGQSVTTFDKQVEPYVKSLQTWINNLDDVEKLLKNMGAPCRKNFLHRIISCKPTEKESSHVSNPARPCNIDFLEKIIKSTADRERFINFIKDSNSRNCQTILRKRLDAQWSKYIKPTTDTVQPFVNHSQPSHIHVREIPETSLVNSIQPQQMAQVSLFNFFYENSKPIVGKMPLKINPNPIKQTP
jgi:hypothetical protein